MLTTIEARPRPAGGRSRRPALQRVLTAALLTIALACNGGGLEGPAPESWREAVGRAIVEIRAADPRAAAEVEELLTGAEHAEAASREWWRPARRAAAGRAWHAVVIAAGRHVREIRLARAERHRTVTQLIRLAVAEVTAAAERSQAGGSRGTDASASAQARVRLAAANALLAAGELDEAAAAAEDAITLADVAQTSWRRLRERLGDPALRQLWQRQVADTLAESRRTGSTALVVDKAAQQLIVYRGGIETTRYAVELGTAGLAPKRHAGDHATPEGRYRVVTVKTGGATRYHAALLLDYPNDDDRRRFALARRSGEIPAGTGIGSLIEVHGHGGQGRDWTEGCVALADNDIDELVAVVGRGTPVTIVGAAEAP